VSGPGEVGPEAKIEGREEETQEVDAKEEEDEEEQEEGEEEEGEDEEDALSPEKLAEMCPKCGARCCTYYTVMLDEPEDADDFDELRWFLAHEDCYIYVDEGEWHLNVISRCRFLGEDARCTIYDHRPDVCREFGHEEECEFTGEYDFEHEFRTLRDLDEYAKKVLSSEELKKLPRFPDGYRGPA
jgi:Fe-S-cluster containining protein